MTVVYFLKSMTVTGNRKKGYVTVKEKFPKYLIQQNLLEVADKCVIIGNIYDNPEILKGDNEK